MFSKELNKKLDKYHLLNHPFYKSWNDGKLTREIIKDYAEQYYQHVKYIAGHAPEFPYPVRREEDSTGQPLTVNNSTHFQ